MKFLVVDDSITMRKVVGLALKSGGYDFDEAKSGEEALELTGSNQYDFFLIDINMPGINGIELVIELRKMDIYKKTPIIILTTETDKSLMDEANKAGINGWIIKPFQKEDLLNKINEII